MIILDYIIFLGWSSNILEFLPLCQASSLDFAFLSNQGFLNCLLNRFAYFNYEKLKFVISKIWNDIISSSTILKPITKA